MNDVITLDENYSTTRRVVKADPQEIAGLVKQSNKPEDKFETVLYLPEGEGRQGEGGLRTKGYFKVGGLISENDVCHSERSEESLKADSHPEQREGSHHSSPLIPDSSQADKPLITVVTVVFNGEKFLEETILSVINQTYDNVEYIIIDGGSTDGTLDIIKKYEHAIDYWVSEKDQGIYDAMNKGIDLATGEWINFMNGGDVFYEKTSINDVFDNEDFSDVDIVYGNHQVVYPSGRKRYAKAGLIKNIWKGSQFCHQASFVKTPYHKIHKFNLCTKIVADFEFFYNAWKKNAQCKFVDVVVALFEAGGVSDIKRIDSIVGRWNIVEKDRKSVV